jgi:hypothetical protein
MDIKNIPQINLAKDPPEVSIVHPLMRGQLIKEAREDRKERKGWYASDLGSCPSGVYYDRLNKKREDMDVKTLLTFLYGKQVHDGVENLIDRTGYLIAKEEALRVEDKKLHASGRPDMLLLVGDQHFLYDIKTVHEFKFRWLDKRGTADEHHIQQIHFYYDLLKDKYPNLHMVIMYAPKGNQAGNVREMYVPYSKTISLKNNVFFTALNNAWKKKKPPKPIKTHVLKDNGKWEVNWKARYCGFHHLCMQDDNWLEKAEREAKQK